MESRTIQIAILVFWFASMTWLARTKILPLLGPSARPDQRIFRPESPDEDQVVCWKIRWSNRTIGWARTEIRRRSMGQGHVKSVVHFDRLPTQKMVREMFGSMSLFVKMLNLGNDDLEVTFTARSEMSFDTFGVLEQLESTVDLQHIGEIFVLKGLVRDEQLALRVLPGRDLQISAGGTKEQDQNALFEKSFRLPPDALVADALSPQSRLAGLAVGQTWQFQSYRAFPPQNPFRLMQADVEREEMIAWALVVEPVKVVTFTDISGSGLTMARTPSNTLWVRDDGTVLKQQMELGNIMIEFIRQLEDDCDAAKSSTEVTP